VHWWYNALHTELSDVGLLTPGLTLGLGSGLRFWVWSPGAPVVQRAGPGAERREFVNPGLTLGFKFAFISLV
jgi:hypothetical protein